MESVKVMNGNGGATIAACADENLNNGHLKNNGHNGHHTNGNGTNRNGTNGYHHDDSSDSNSDTDRSTSVNGNVVEVTKLNGQLAEDEDISRLSMALGLEEAMKEAQNPNTAGVIIFKDQNGIAPPITMTIMKSGGGKSSVTAEEENNFEDNHQQINSQISHSIISQSYAGHHNHQHHINGNGTTETETMTTPIKTVNFDNQDGSQPLSSSVPPQQQQLGSNGTTKVIGKSILKQVPSRTTDPRSFVTCDMNVDKEQECVKSKYNPVSSFSFVGPARRKLRTVAKQKQDEQEAQFEDLRSRFKLNKDARDILSLDWNTLIDQLQTRKLKSTQVLGAFIAKSLEATAYCNAVTEFYPRAMEIAEELDAMSEVKGPLHGIPFCVKDDTDLEGMDSTLGFAKNCYQPKKETAALVQALQKLGGVPFCKTNVPQTLLSFGSDNPVYGVTTSSHNNKLGPGGSSSGTGALVGSFGCWFGTGTDIGGSLRMPSHFNGASTVKPTFGRCTVRGITATLPNIMGLDATSGIIGRNAQVVAHVYKLLLENNFQQQFDPKVLPIPWDEKLFSSTEKLRIGYFTQVPYFPPVGDTIATVEKAVDALRSQGHTLIPMTQLPDGAKVLRVAANFILADGSLAVKKLWEGEEVAKCAELNELGSKCPMWIMRLFAKLLQQKSILPWIYSTRLGSMIDAGAFSSASLWDNKNEQKKIVEELLSEWRQLRLDCCVCPVMPFPAVPLNLPGLLPMATIYTMLWNVVDFPAGVVKYGVETGENVDSYDTEGDQALKLAKNACKESVGSPIGVQVVALPYKEEMVLRVMGYLEQSNN